METISFDENNNSAPKAPMSDGSKRKKKLIAAGVVLAVLILSVIGWQYWQYTQTPYYKQMQVVKELEKMAKESDKWGGKTPEETVALFSDAVKKGDFELASRYGNLNVDIKSELEKMKTNGQIAILINGLGKGKLEENMGFGGNSFDLRVEEGNEKYWVMGLSKSESGIWKIDQF